MHSSWQQGIEAWRFHLPTEYQPSPYIADTVFDRTLLRAGETVHMKHFIRAKTVDGLSLVPTENLPDTLSITFSGGDQHYDFDLKWNDSGSAENDWQIPKAAKLGTYNVTMSRRKTASRRVRHPLQMAAIWAINQPRNSPPGIFASRNFESR